MSRGRPGGDGAGIGRRVRGRLPQSPAAVGVEALADAVVVQIEGCQVGDAVSVGIPHRIIATTVAVEVESDGIEPAVTVEVEVGRGPPVCRRCVSGAEVVLDGGVHTDWTHRRRRRFRDTPPQASVTASACFS